MSNTVDYVTLRERVARALMQVDGFEDEDAPYQSWFPQAAAAILEVLDVVAQVPCDGKDSALGYRHEVLAVFQEVGIEAR